MTNCKAFVLRLGHLAILYLVLLVISSMGMMATLLGTVDIRLLRLPSVGYFILFTISVGIAAAVFLVGESIAYVVKDIMGVRSPGKFRKTRFLFLIGAVTMSGATALLLMAIGRAAGV